MSDWQTKVSYGVAAAATVYFLSQKPWERQKESKRRSIQGLLFFFCVCMYVYSIYHFFLPSFLLSSFPSSFLFLFLPSPFSPSLSFLNFFFLFYFQGQMTISRLMVYPVKSMGAYVVNEWDAAPQGLIYDRRFVLCFSLFSLFSLFSFFSLFFLFFFSFFSLFFSFFSLFFLFFFSFFSLFFFLFFLFFLSNNIII